MKYNSFILLLFFYSTVNAQSGKATFSLKEAIDFAMSNNNVVKNKVIDKKIATAQKGEQGAKGLPQVNANVDLLHYQNNQKNIFENGIGFSTRPDLGIGDVYAIQLGLKNQLLPTVSASQVLFDPSYFAGLRASKTYTQLAEKSIVMSKIEVAAAVTKAYYAVLVNEIQLAYINVNLGRLDSAFKQTKAQFENCLSRSIDVDRSEVSFNNLKEEKSRISRLLKLSKSLLKYQMNLSPEDSLTLTDKLDESMLAELLQTTKQEKTNYSSRIEYSMIETQSVLNKMETRNARGGFYPRLSAIGAIGYNPGASQFANLAQDTRWYAYSYVGLRLQVPIFNGFAVHFKTQQKKLQAEKTANDKKQLERRIDLEIDQSLVNLENSLASLNNQKRNLSLAEKSLAVLKAESKEGLTTNLEVTIAEAELKAAQTNFYNALYEALVAKADYEKATGNLLK